MVSHGIPELETYLQIVEGVTHLFLAASPYCVLGQEADGFIVFYVLTFDLNSEDTPTKLFATHHALPDIIIPIPADQLEKTTLGKLLRAHLMNQFRQGGLGKHIACSELLAVARGANFIIPPTDTKMTLAGIYADIFNLNMSDISMSENFFKLGGTSIDVIMLKRDGEAAFELPEVPMIQILKYPVVSSLAKYIKCLILKDASMEEYDPIIPLNLIRNKIPIFMVHPSVREVLTFMNIIKYFQNEQPFYAFHA